MDGGLALRARILAAGVVAGVVATLLTTSATTSAEATTTSTPAPATGVVSDITWGIAQADVDRTVASIAGAGATWVRANVSWSGGEPDAKGTLNTGYLAKIDYAVSKARSAGLDVLMPIADGVPYWASADPNKYQDASGRHWNTYWRPTSFSDYADFVRTVVLRYAPMGVHTFEIWNEPNTTRFWPSGPNAAEYEAMLAATYPVVKAADPQATVLMGGLSKNDYNYLQSLYAAGARTSFDAANVHPYSGKVDPTVCWNQSGTTKLAVDAFCAIEEVYRTMSSNGDSAKPLWLTEFGWSTTTNEYGVSESVQADYLKKAYTKVASYPYVAAAFWYDFRDTRADPADYEANLGLVRNDFTAKPAYAAMQSIASAQTATVADSTPPAISGIGARNVKRYSADVVWTTNESSDSTVEYWVSSTKTVHSATVVTSHAISLSGLSRRTKYSYRVKSADAAGNLATSATYTFTTAR